MCHPVALTVASTAMQVVGGLNQANAQKAQARYQAQIAQNNQIIAERNARLAREEGKVEEQQHRRKLRAFIGRQRALMGGSGTRLDEGDNLDILADSAMLGELDALTILNNAERRARGFDQQAQIAGWEADMSRHRGRMISPFLDMAPTLLSGGAKVFSQLPPSNPRISS